MTSGADIALICDSQSSQRDCLFQIKGAITFTTVALLRNKGNQLFKEAKRPHLTFDFAKVTHCNSGALALLTSWARYAKALGKSASFINLPATLMDVAKLSHLEKILSLD